MVTCRSFLLLFTLLAFGVSASAAEPADAAKPGPDPMAKGDDVISSNGTSLVTVQEPAAKK